MAKEFVCIFLTTIIVAVMSSPQTGHRAVFAAVQSPHYQPYQPQPYHPYHPFSSNPSRAFVAGVHESGSTHQGGAAVIAGGLGEERQADEHLRNLVEKLKPAIIERLCSNPNFQCPPPNSKISVFTFKSQTVAGVNYFVRLTVNNVHYDALIHYQSWTNTLTLTAIKAVQPHTPITYFQ